MTRIRGMTKKKTSDEHVINGVNSLINSFFLLFSFPSHIQPSPHQPTDKNRQLQWIADALRQKFWPSHRVTGCDASRRLVWARLKSRYFLLLLWSKTPKESTGHCYWRRAEETRFGVHWTSWMSSNVALDSSSKLCMETRRMQPD